MKSRPKTLKKPSARSLRREARRKLRRRSSWAFSSSNYFTNGGPAITDAIADYVTWTETASANATATIDAAGDLITPRTIAIESLDEGLTWHTADTMEQAVNRDGQIIIGHSIAGQAPECMREGSGTYRFDISWRLATEQESIQWQADHQAHQMASEAAARERATKRKAAAERAGALLLSHLDRKAKADLESKGGFWVRSQFGNRYWVTKSTAVRFDERGVALQRYCIHAIADVPAEDNALMRKLVLECNEDLFLKTANPSLPSEWDVRFHQQVQFVNAGMTDFAANAHANMTFVPALPVLMWVNGVLRPLTG